MGKIKITADLESLFPGTSITIGNQEIPIKPMRFSILAAVVKQLKGFGEELGKIGVNFSNCSRPENLMHIADVLVTKFPDALAEASNIERESLESLPLDIIVEILTKVVEVNLNAKDSFLKNFKSLAEKIKTLFPKQEKKSQ